MSIATISPARAASKAQSHGEWCRRQIFLRTLGDARRVASRAAEKICGVQIQVVFQESSDSLSLIVADRVIGWPYEVPIKERLSRFDIARLVVNEIRSQRDLAGAPKWELSLPSAWLVA
jgi:hypothetical protein